MAGSVNKVIILGNLGVDPEVRNFPNGGKVCNLRIATSENWKDRNTGARREKTEWHSVATIETVEAGDALAGQGGVNVDKIKLWAWRGSSVINNVDTEFAGVGWVLAEAQKLT